MFGEIRAIDMRRRSRSSAGLKLQNAPARHLNNAQRFPTTDMTFDVWSACR
jgi:hypothetical protein